MKTYRVYSIEESENEYRLVLEMNFNIFLKLINVNIANRYDPNDFLEAVIPLYITAGKDFKIEEIQGNTIEPWDKKEHPKLYAFMQKEMNNLRLKVLTGIVEVESA